MANKILICPNPDCKKPVLKTDKYCIYCRTPLHPTRSRREPVRESKRGTKAQKRVRKTGAHRQPPAPQGVNWKVFVVGLIAVVIAVRLFSSAPMTSSPPATATARLVASPTNLAPSATATQVRISESGSSQGEAVPSLPNGAEKWTIVLSEPFVNNNNGWVFDLDGEEKNGAWTRSFNDANWAATIVIAGTYQLSVERSYGLVYVDYPNAPETRDFYLSTKVRLVTGDPETSRYGLFFRCQHSGRNYCSPTGGTYYYLEISPEQEFKVSYHSGNTSGETLIGWTKSAQINAFGWNEIGVVGIDNTYFFIINGDVVGSITDAKLRNGTLGIRVAQPAGTRAVYEYDDFVIRSP